MLDEDDEDLAQIPAGALMVMKILADQLRTVDAHVSAIDEQIEAWQRESAAAQALKTIPGIGALISAALAAHVPDPSIFRSRPRLRRVARSGSATELQRRKGKAWQDNEARQSVSAPSPVLGATASLRWSTNGRIHWPIGPSGFCSAGRRAL
jgi:transposase